MSTFEKTQLNRELVNQLKNDKKTIMTEVQEKVIPLILSRRQVICTAPTGSGKTYSFVLPILNNIDLENKTTQAMIITPTRELARQIYNVFREFKSDKFDVSIALAVGGEDLSEQVDRFESRPHIIIGTPTRIEKVISSLSNEFSSNVEYLVVDEADMNIDLKFLPTIKNIISEIKNDDLTTTFFSATIPLQLQNFINNNIDGKFEYVNIKGGSAGNNVSHYMIKSRYDERLELLLQMLNSDKINPFFAIIFGSTKKEVDLIYNFLSENLDAKIGKFSADLQPRKRKTELKLINNNDYQYVVASDLLSRGIDVVGASHVFNFSIPEIGLEYYMHRSGRVGRHDLDGVSYLFYDDDDKYRVDKLKSNKKINFEEFKWNKREGNLAKVKKSKTKSFDFNSPEEMEVARIISRYKNGKRKPGYKTKMKEEIDNVRRKYKKLENREKRKMNK